MSKILCKKINRKKCTKTPTGITVEHRLKSPRPVATSVLLHPVRRRHHTAEPKVA